jgi:FkbM family methyltransferase
LKSGVHSATEPAEVADITEFAELAGVKLDMAGLDPTVRSAIVDRSYEAGELRALALALQPDDVVLELGTGLGLLSTWCAQRIGSARVHTFEANPGLEPRIRQTWALNQVEPSLGVAMLGEHAGEHDFHVHEAFWASSATDPSGAERTVRVPVRPLNDEIRRIRPSLLIMDIEGGEAELLRFADLDGVQRIVAEFHERMLGRDAIDTMMGRLYGEGFRIVREASEWEVALLERVSHDDRLRHVLLDEFLSGRWRLGPHWAASSFERLCALIPAGSRYALIDGDQWRVLQVLPERERVAFVEQGVPGGPRWGEAPQSDDEACAELARQRARGLRTVVFESDSAWWLQHYPRFASALASAGQRISDAQGAFQGYLLD